MTIKNLKELNGEKNGVFTIVVSEEKNSFVITGRFMMQDTIVYHRELDKVSEILSDIKGFGFNVELIKEPKIFKILFDKDDERVIMTSNEIIDKNFLRYVERNRICKSDYDGIIEVFRGKGKYEILEVEL